MVVTHGRRSRGRRDKYPQNLEREDCPPDFVKLQNVKHQITCITMYVFLPLQQDFYSRPKSRHASPPQNSSQICAYIVTRVLFYALIIYVLYYSSWQIKWMFEWISVSSLITSLKWATNSGISSGSHDDCQPTTGMHEGVLQVRTVQQGIHSDNVVVPERHLLTALHSCPERADAVHRIGHGQSYQADVGRLLHGRGVHRRSHPPPWQHHHAEDVADQSEHAQRRIDDLGE